MPIPPMTSAPPLKALLLGLALVAPLALAPLGCGSGATRRGLATEPAPEAHDAVPLADRVLVYPRFVVRETVQFSHATIPPPCAGDAGEDIALRVQVRAEEILARDADPRDPELARALERMRLATWPALMRLDLDQSLADPPEETLAAWYEQNPDRYLLAEPVARFEYVFAPLLEEDDPAAIEARLAELSAAHPDWPLFRSRAAGEGFETTNTPTTATPRRVHSALGDFLFADESTERSGVIRTTNGFHVVLRQRMTPARGPDLHRDRDRVRADWREAAVAEQIARIEEVLPLWVPLAPGPEEGQWMLDGEQITDEELLAALRAAGGEEAALDRAATALLRQHRHERFALAQGFDRHPLHRALLAVGEANVRADRVMDLLVREEAAWEPDEATLRAAHAETPERWATREERGVVLARLPLPPLHLFEDPLEGVRARRAVRQQLARVREMIEAGWSQEEARRLARQQGIPVEWIDMGTAPEGPRGRDLDVAVRGLGPGQVGPIQRTPDDFRFHLVTTVVPPSVPPLEEAREEIRRTLRVDRVNQAAAARIAQAVDRAVAEECR